MCGLFGGASSSLIESELQTIRWIAGVSFFRGVHSSGMAVASTEGKRKKRRVGDYHTIKRLSDPYGFMFDPDVIEIQRKSPTAIIGHCRQATVGSISRENAHPYTIGNTIGAHNGTIDSLQDLAKKEGTTDSYQFYKHVEEYGIDSAVEEHSDGAYALTWFDTEEDTLNILRNDKRPLWFMPGHGTIYWASERCFLQIVKDHINIKVDEPIMVPSHTLITYHLPFNNKMATREVKPKPKTFVPGMYSSLKKVFGQGTEHKEETKVLPFIPTSTNTSNTSTQESSTLYKPKVLEPTAPPSPLTSMTTGNKLPINKVFASNALVNSNTLDKATTLFTGHEGDYPMVIRLDNNTTKILKYRHPDGRMIDISDMHKLMAKGCAVSSYRPKMSDPMVWINADEWVCEEYQDDAFLMEYIATSLDTSAMPAGYKPKAGWFVYGTVHYFRNRESLLAKKKNESTIKELQQTINDNYGDHTCTTLQ